VIARRVIIGGALRHGDMTNPTDLPGMPVTTLEMTR